MGKKKCNSVINKGKKNNKNKWRDVITKGLPDESSWSLVLRSKRLLVKIINLSPPFLVLLSTWLFHTLNSSKGEQRRNLWVKDSKKAVEKDETLLLRINRFRTNHFTFKATGKL